MEHLQDRMMSPHTKSLLWNTATITRLCGDIHCPTKYTKALA